MQTSMIDSNQAQSVLAQQFSAKYSSKKEVFNFLTRKVKCFLPHYDCIHILFMRDIVQGKKEL